MSLTQGALLTICQGGTVENPNLQVICLLLSNKSPGTKFYEVVNCVLTEFSINMIILLDTLSFLVYF